MLCALRHFAVLLLLGFSAQLAAQTDASTLGEWPQFLGPNRNGISAERNLLETWPTGGPQEVWRVKGGVGMSGLAISRGRLLTLVQTDGQQRLISLDANTGKAIWQTPLAPAFTNPMGEGPRATPTIAGERVFAFTGEGVLAAVNFSDGKILWSHNLLEQLGGKLTDYGMACSPLVDGQQVVVMVGAPDASVVALDVSTGKIAWTAGKDPAGYSSPALLQVGGERQIVAFTGASAIGLSPSSGEVRWRYPYVTDFNCNIATPLALDGKVFLSSGENHGSVLLSFKDVGHSMQASEVWKSQGPKSVLRNEWQTSILLDGHLYGFDNVGGAGPVSHLTCINAATGERVWQQLRFGKGNLIAADGKLFISTINGELVVVRAAPKAFEELGRSMVIGQTRQAPALAKGLLYLRDNEEIVCLNVRRQ